MQGAGFRVRGAECRVQGLGCRGARFRVQGSGFRVQGSGSFCKSFCKSQFPHKSVNLSFIITNIKSQLTDVCGNELLQNDAVNPFCEIQGLLETKDTHSPRVLQYAYG